MTELEVTEEELVETMRKKGFDEWDIGVALGGLRKGVSLDFGGGFRFVLKEESQD